MPDENAISVEKFRAVCALGHKLTDKELWDLLQNVTVGSEEDITMLVSTLHKYSPQLEKRLLSRFSIDQGRFYEEILPGIQKHRRDLEDPDDFDI